MKVSLEIEDQYGDSRRKKRKNAYLNLAVSFKMRIF